MRISLPNLTCSSCWHIYVTMPRTLKHALTCGSISKFQRDGYHAAFEVVIHAWCTSPPPPLLFHNFIITRRKSAPILFHTLRANYFRSTPSLPPTPVFHPICASLIFILVSPLPRSPALATLPSISNLHVSDPHRRQNPYVHFGADLACLASKWSRKTCSGRSMTLLPAKPVLQLRFCVA